MKRLTLALFIALFALPLFAQEATLPADQDAKPALRKIKVEEFDVNKNGCLCGSVHVFYESTDGTRKDKRRIDWGPETSSTLAEFLTAIGTARSGETGTATRRANFRILGFLFDEGLLPSGTTVSP